jgi:hypothetical protein
MKKNWDKRLTALEMSSKLTHMDFFLDEWLRQNYDKQSLPDYFTLADLVPRELRLACIFRGLAAIRKAHN